MGTMKLPELDHPERYGGLYVFDFGGQVAVGYTADEIAVLLESERYKDGKVYRIHRALPDGTVELQGVSREQFTAEEAMLFCRQDEDSARRDFEVLDALVQRTSPPCRMKGHLVRLEESRPFGPAAKQGSTDVSHVGMRETYATVMIYPAEYTHDVSKWLGEADYRGGDYVEGGISVAAAYYSTRATVFERRQWWPAVSASRSTEEVLASTHLAVQRQMAG